MRHDGRRQSAGEFGSKIPLHSGSSLSLRTKRLDHCRQLPDDDPIPRRGLGRHVRLFRGGVILGAGSNAFYRYDPLANNWTTLAPMPASLYAARGAYSATNNSFYVFGGFNGTTVLNTTYRYNVVTNTWSTAAAMPAARFFPNVAYYPGHGYIYVNGGFDSSSVETSQTWEYDPVANTWATRENSPVALAGSGTSSDDDRYSTSRAPMGVASAQLCTIATMAATVPGWPWLLLPVAVYSPVTGVIGRKIFVAGAATPRPAPGPGEAGPAGMQAAAPDASFNSSYIYDIASNSWTTGPNMNVAHAYTQGAVIGNNLLVVGGYNGSADSNVVEINALTGCATPTPCPVSYNVLLVFAENSKPSTLPNALLVEPGISGVTIHNEGVVHTPPLNELEFYQIVVVWSNSAWLDPTTLGNNLGSYLAGGGIVVAFNFDWFGGTNSIGGTWATTYTPFTNPGAQNFVDGTLATCTFAPLCTGVSSLNAHFRETMGLAPGATLGGVWNDGTPMIAIKGRAVGVSAYVGDNPNGSSGQVQPRDCERRSLAHPSMSSYGQHIGHCHRLCHSSPSRGRRGDDDSDG